MVESVDFDDYTQNYNQLLQEGTSFFTESDAYFAKYKVALCKSRIHHPVQRILEYGCGIGRNIPFLQKAFPEATVIGSDISKASLDFARAEQPGVAFMEENNPELDGMQFDLIFVAGVFHHIPPAERDGAARTLFNRLKPGGNVVVFEHNPYNPITRRIVSNCPYDEDAILLTPKELQAHLKTAGLQSVTKQFCLFVPPKLSWLLWLERWLTWLPLGGQYFVQFAR